VTEKVSSKPASKSATPVPAAAQNGPIPPVDTKPSVSEATQGTTAPAAAPNVATTKAGPGPAPASSSATATPQTPSKAPPSGPKNDRFVPAIPISNPTTKPATTAAATQSVASVAGGATTQATASQGTAQAAITEAARAATAAVAAAMAKLPQPNAQKKAQQNDANVETVTKKLNDLKTYDGNRGHRGQGPRGGRGSHRNQHHAPAKKIEVPDTDFDFESANAKFNKQDLVKEAIASGSPMRESEEKDANGAGTEGAKETIPVPTAPGPAYNKASSFFDNISSEIRDREEGIRPRERRGEEEKKNIETFGQGSVDGYRGSYRNRGRGRNYGGSRGRSGYNRSYNNRGRGALRGGRGASQATGVPAQT
ncbi:G2/M phase checkpoint control protein Sum2, partial [Rasamsonia emersonii CBS 393.64]